MRTETLLLLVCAATGNAVTICRTKNYQPQEFNWCPAGSIINITAASVGFRTYPIWLTKRQCIADCIRCCKPTNSPEIMQCNGRQNCSLGEDAFNYPGSFRSCGWKGNFINVTYNCIAGKSKCFNCSAFHKLYVGITQYYHITSQYLFNVLLPVTKQCDIVRCDRNNINVAKIDILHFVMQTGLYALATATVCK